MRKTLSTALAFFFFFLSCGEQEQPSLNLKYKSSYDTILLKNWNQEYLPFDSVLINGSFSVVNNEKSLYKLLGNPDRIMPMPINRNNLHLIGKNKPYKAEYLIYGNTIFEKSGEDIIVNTIDFESTNIELVHPKITLNKGTRPIEIQKAFPESGRLIGGSGNSWSGNIMISASKPYGGINDVWFLIFKNERLCRVVLYTVPGLEDVYYRR